MSDVYRAPGTTQSGPMAAPVSRPYDDDVGTGWVAVAGVMISIAGLMNVIDGLIAHGSRERRG